MDNKCEYFNGCSENYKSFCKEVSELTLSKVYCLIRKDKSEKEFTNHTFSFDMKCNEMGVKEIKREFLEFLETRQNWAYKNVKVVNQKEALKRIDFVEFD